MAGFQAVKLGTITYKDLGNAATRHLLSISRDNVAHYEQSRQKIERIIRKEAEFSSYSFSDNKRVTKKISVSGLLQLYIY